MSERKTLVSDLLTGGNLPIMETGKSRKIQLFQKSEMKIDVSNHLISGISR